MLDEILTSLSEELGIKPDSEYAKKFLASVKEAVPVSQEVMEKDWAIYAEKLSKKLRAEGQEAVELSFVFQSWCMTWMDTSMTLISAMMLVALTSVEKGGPGDGLP